MPKVIALRHFTAAFNAGVEFAQSIAGQLDDRLYESVDETRPHNLQDLIGTLSEMKLDETELKDVVNSLADASFPAKENDNPQEFQIDVVPVSEALRIYAECVPIDDAVAKALFPPRPDGFLVIMQIDREGKTPVFMPRLPIEPYAAGIARYAAVFCGSWTDVNTDSDLPF